MTELLNFYFFFLSSAQPADYFQRISQKKKGKKEMGFDQVSLGSVLIIRYF